MKLGVFVNDYKGTVETVDRLKAEKLGLIFIQNGVFHATLKENGKSSPLLEKSSNLYVLSEDLQTRGMTGRPWRRWRMCTVKSRKTSLVTTSFWRPQS